MTYREIAREISYASSARTRGGRTFVRVVENATGRIGLIRRARGYETEVAAGQDFWRVIADRYGLSVEILGGSLASIPAQGPLILIANHPYGILDGLVMGRILSEIRGDFRIVAHQVFRRAEDIQRVILPISFEDTKESVRLNIETRMTSLRYLDAGGAIGIFPGGTVSTATRPFGQPMDPGWRKFTAKMIARSDATVIPVYFDGHNSRLFQIASHMHQTLRTALLIKEFRARIDAPVRIVVGEAIARATLDRYRGEPKQMMDFLRRATYELSPEPLGSLDYGLELEAKYRA